MKMKKMSLLASILTMALVAGATTADEQGSEGQQSGETSSGTESQSSSDQVIDWLLEILGDSCEVNCGGIIRK